MSGDLSGAVLRLLECLKCPLDSRLLGRQTVREIFYRVLRSEQGGALRALARRDEHFSREFKRLFGVTPVEGAEHTRSRLVVS
jgi:methylphosphotriester-DNA--protein-cysteine methyltransferase